MFEFTNVTETLVFLGMMIIGGLLATAVPYIFQKWNDPKTAVDKKYLTVLIFSTILAAFMYAPASVEVINNGQIRIAAAAGYGLATFIMQMVSAVFAKGNLAGVKK